MAEHTWQHRAQELEAELAQARAELSAARAVKDVLRRLLKEAYFWVPIKSDVRARIDAALGKAD